jgi:hypothetical protein
VRVHTLVLTNAVVADRQFVDTFLAGAQCAQANLRASSLSNLGSVCELMRFSLHPYVHGTCVLLSHTHSYTQACTVRNTHDASRDGAH